MGNYLVISEGKHPEEEILKFLFKKLGYRFLPCVNDFDFSDCFHEYFDSAYDLGTQAENRVFFLHLKNPRVKRLYSDLKKSYVLPLPDLVSRRPFFFEATFLLHDVDHYYVTYLKGINRLCNQPATGQLLLSIPCIEAINESTSMHEGEWLDPSDYCRDLLGRCGGKPSVDYFKKHAKELLLSHLKHDGTVFALPEFIDWPDYLAENLGKYYDRRSGANNQGTLVYRHFTSLAYIMLGVVRKYHLEENSTELLRELIETLF